MKKKNTCGPLQKSIWFALLSLTACGPSAAAIFKSPDSTIEWSGQKECWMNRMQPNGKASFLLDSYYQCEAGVKRGFLGFYQDKTITYQVGRLSRTYNAVPDEQCNLTLKDGASSSFVFSHGELNEKGRLTQLEIKTAEDSSIWRCTYVSFL